MGHVGWYREHSGTAVCSFLNGSFRHCSCFIEQIGPGTKVWFSPVRVSEWLHLGDPACSQQHHSCLLGKEQHAPGLAGRDKTQWHLGQWMQVLVLAQEIFFSPQGNNANRKWAKTPSGHMQQLPVSTIASLASYLFSQTALHEVPGSSHFFEADYSSAFLFYSGLSRPHSIITRSISIFVDRIFCGCCFRKKHVGSKTGSLY